MSQFCKVKACQRCGKDYQPVSRNQKYCVDCGRVEEERKAIAFRVAHKAERAARMKIYNATNKEKTAARMKIYNATNKVRIAARGAEYYLANRDEILARMREHYIPSEGMPARICDRCGRNYQPTDSMQKYCPECSPIENKIKTAILNADPEHRVRTAVWSKAYEAGSERKIKRRARDKIRYPARHADPKQIAYHAEYREVNHEKLAKLMKEWALANPEKVRMSAYRTRAKRRDLPLHPIFTNLWFPGCDLHHHEDLIYTTYMPRWMHQGKGNGHNHFTGKGMAKMDAKAWAYAGVTADVLDDTLPFD